MKRNGTNMNDMGNVNNRALGGGSDAVTPPNKKRCDASELPKSPFHLERTTSRDSIPSLDPSPGRQRTNSWSIRKPNNRNVDTDEELDLSIKLPQSIETGDQEPVARMEKAVEEQAANAVKAAKKAKQEFEKLEALKSAMEAGGPECVAEMEKAIEEQASKTVEAATAAGHELEKLKTLLNATDGDALTVNDMAILPD